MEAQQDRIKRRSAFTQHLKKHGISLEGIDIDSLAPTILPRQAPCQVEKKSLRTTVAQHTQTHAAEEAMLLPVNVTYHNGTVHHQREGPNGSVVHNLEQRQGPPSVMNERWSQGALELPTLRRSGLFAIEMSPHNTERLLTFDSPSPFYSCGGYMDSPMSNPGLSYSASPSPSLSHQSPLNFGLDMRGYVSSSSYSTPAPSPPPAYADHNAGQNSTTDWKFFVASQAQLNVVHV
ncbi:hypothetical protein C0991_003570 [Blastosporella zonata]|nr:hypothetical protein C0991_003570 [Blastosporella zonata]